MSEMRAARKLQSRTCFGGLRKRAAEKLAQAGIESAELDARLLMSFASGLEAVELVSRGAQETPEDIAARFETLVERRFRGEPVARIVGKKEFWSHEFLLGPDTLVPRPESEAIVEAALAAKADRNAVLRVMDMGTGTGILLAAILLERPNATGLALDRNEDALRIARANFQRLALAGRASFVCGDWGAAVGQKFDLVVSNPPYVGTSVIASLKPEIRDHDPALALDGGMDGLDAYRAICASLAGLLLPRGAAVLELGLGQQTAVSEIAQRAGLTVNDVKMDLAGHPRALVLASGKDKKALGSIREPH